MTTETQTQENSSETDQTSEPGITPFLELSRLMAVAIQNNDGALVSKAQTVPDGPWQDNWTSVADGSYDLLDSGSTRDGRVAIVAQGKTDQHIYYIDEASDETDSKWNTPADLGRPAADVSLLALAMARDAQGRIEIFGADTANHLWWIYQNPDKIVEKKIEVTPPGSDKPIIVTAEVSEPPDNPWSDWQQLPSPPNNIIRLMVENTVEDWIYLFLSTEIDTLYRLEQTKATSLQPDDWSQPIEMTASMTPTFDHVTTELDIEGAINLFAVDNNGQIIHTKQSPPNGPTWSPWTYMSIISLSPQNSISALSVGIDGDDDLTVAARTDDGYLHANNQRSAEFGQWYGWNVIGHTSANGEIILDYNSDGRQSLFYHVGSEDNSLGLISQLALNSTEWTAEWTMLATDNVSQVSVTRDLTP